MAWTILKRKKDLFVYFLVLVWILAVEVKSMITLLPNVRDLSLSCAVKNESEIFCATFPKGCEKKKPGHPCEMITTIIPYDLPCIKSNLGNSYIRTLCAKRSSMFLVTLFRSVPADEKKRSCIVQDISSGKDCINREYVGVSFSKKKGSSGPEDKDLFYICTSDQHERHVTTWTKKGTQKIEKWIQQPDRYKDPYQLKIFKSSGVGVYWENVAMSVGIGTEVVCEFVISVEDVDMEYTDSSTGEHSTPPLRVQLSLNDITYLKMVQGMVNWVTSNITDTPEIKKVIMDKSENSEPGGLKTDFKFEAFDNKLNLTLLELNMVRSHGRHLREVIAMDEKLRLEYWHPLFEECRTRKRMCYIMDPDPLCFRENKESCALMIAFKFTKKYKKLVVRMLVEQWPWGGFTFSEDRIMSDEIGFYCQYTEPFINIKAQIHLYHSSKVGNDTKLLDLITVLKNVSQISGSKRYCEFSIPSKYSISQSPHYPDRKVVVDFINKEYHLLVALGSNQKNSLAYHKEHTIMPILFSKSIYKEYVSAGETTKTSIINQITYLLLSIIPIMTLNLLQV